jgi:hypothetical protein
LRGVYSEINLFSKGSDRVRGPPNGLFNWYQGLFPRGNIYISTISTAVFWDVASCSLADRYQKVRGNVVPHLRIRQVTGPCECGNELSGSIKCGEFLGYLRF